MQIRPFEFLSDSFYLAQSERYVDRRYLHSHVDILSTLGNRLAAHGVNPPIFRGVMGTESYLFRFPHEREVLDVAAYILRTDR